MKFSKRIINSYIGKPEDDTIVAITNIEGLWAIYKDDIITTTDFYKGSHYDWFESIGFPTKYPEFDKIIRGFFDIDNRVLRITITEGSSEEVLDKSSRLIDTIGYKDSYNSFEFYYKNKRVAKKSFKLYKEADVKEVVDKVYNWIKKKLKEEKSTEIELRKDLSPKVETELEKEEGVEESGGVVKRVIDTVIKKLKDEGSVLVTEEKPIPKDEEEIEDDIEDGKENDLLTNISNAARTYNMLWIQYRDRKGKFTERFIEPWEKTDTGYLYAHDPKFTKHHRSDVGTRRFIMMSIMDSKVSKKPYLKKDRWEMRIT